MEQFDLNWDGQTCQVSESIILQLVSKNFIDT